MEVFHQGVNRTIPPVTDRQGTGTGGGQATTVVTGNGNANGMAEDVETVMSQSVKRQCGEMHGEQVTETDKIIMPIMVTVSFSKERSDFNNGNNSEWVTELLMMPKSVTVTVKQGKTVIRPLFSTQS